MATLRSLRASPTFRLSSNPSAAITHPALEHPAAATIAQQVSEAFAMVSAPECRWALDFLLDRSPAATAQMLTNPAALEHAVTSHLTDTATSPRSDDQAVPGLYDHSIDVEVLSVPAFASGDLCLSVVAHSITAASPGASVLSAGDAPPKRSVHSGMFPIDCS
jgi:hypothetical protein